MPLPIDESWEYWTPSDPDIADILCAASSCCPIDRLCDYRLRKHETEGIRFGNGNPDHFWGKLAPKKHTASAITLKPIECRTCGTVFQPDRARRKYCSFRCILHAGRERELSETVACATCGASFRPRYAIHRYCSRWCSGEAQRAVPVEVSGGCKCCGNPIPPSLSRNQKAIREYCSKKCKHRVLSRRWRQRLAGGLEEVQN